MTHKEKIIATAYTGIVFIKGDELGDYYAYAEEKLNQPVIGLTLCTNGYQERLREACKDDFLKMINGDFENEKD